MRKLFILLAFLFIAANVQAQAIQGALGNSGDFLMSTGTSTGVQDIEVIFVNGATAQTVWLRYAKPTSGTAILKPGSYVDVWKQ